MKKLLCLTLAVLMILSLCACGGSSAGNQEEPEEKPQLEIGFGRVNITPSYAVGMSSSGTEKHRRHEGIIACLLLQSHLHHYIHTAVDALIQHSTIHIHTHLYYIEWSLTFHTRTQ